MVCPLHQWGPRTSQHSGPNAAVLAPPTSSAWPERIYLDNPVRISSASGCFGSKCLESMHYRMSWCAVPEAEREDYFFCLSCIMMSQLWKNDSGYIKRRPSRPSVRSSLANPQPYQILSISRCRWWSNSHVLVCSIQACRTATLFCWARSCAAAWSRWNVVAKWHGLATCIENWVS